MIPRVPNDPVANLGRSYPATFFTTLPPLLARVPSGRASDTNNQVAQASEANTKRPALVGRPNPSDRRLVRPKRVEGQSLTMLGQSLLQLLECAPGFHRRRHVAPSVFH